MATIRTRIGANKSSRMMATTPRISSTRYKSYSYRMPMLSMISQRDSSRELMARTSSLTVAGYRLLAVIGNRRTIRSTQA